MELKMSCQSLQMDWEPSSQSSDSGVRTRLTRVSLCQDLSNVSRKSKQRTSQCRAWIFQYTFHTDLFGQPGFTTHEKANLHFEHPQTHWIIESLKMSIPNNSILQFQITVGACAKRNSFNYDSNQTYLQYQSSTEYANYQQWPSSSSKLYGYSLFGSLWYISLAGALLISAGSSFSVLQDRIKSRNILPE